MASVGDLIDRQYVGASSFLFKDILLYLKIAATAMISLDSTTIDRMCKGSTFSKLASTNNGHRDNFKIPFSRPRGMIVIEAK